QILVLSLVQEDPAERADRGARAVRAGQDDFRRRLPDRALGILQRARQKLQRRVFLEADETANRDIPRLRTLVLELLDEGGAGLRLGDILKGERERENGEEHPDSLDELADRFNPRIDQVLRP